MKLKSRRIIGVILALVMMIQVLPIAAFASFMDLAENTTAENTLLLEELEEMYGSDAAQYIARLNELGFLNEDGSMDVEAELNVGGELMTLAEVEEMLEDPATDLTKVIDVEGYDLVLSDLKLMLEIEREAMRIYETYYSEQVWTGEQLDVLADLESAIAEGRFSMYSSADAANVDTAGLGSVNHGATLEWMTAAPSDGSGHITKTIVLSGANPGQTVYFKVLSTDGTAKSGNVAYGGTGEYSGFSGASSYSITADNLGYGERDFTFQVNANFQNLQTDLWSGYKVFFAHIFDVTGASVPNPTAPLNLERYYDFGGVYNSNDKADFKLEFTRPDNNIASVTDTFTDTAKKWLQNGIFSELEVQEHGYSSSNPSLITRYWNQPDGDTHDRVMRFTNENIGNTSNTYYDADKKETLNGLFKVHNGLEMYINIGGSSGAELYSQKRGYVDVPEKTYSTSEFDSLDEVNALTSYTELVWFNAITDKDVSDGFFAFEDTLTYDYTYINRIQDDGTVSEGMGGANPTSYLTHEGTYDIDITDSSIRSNVISAGLKVTAIKNATELYYRNGGYSWANVFITADKHNQWGLGNNGSVVMTLTDSEAPTLEHVEIIRKGIEGADGLYNIGEKVPVILTFSEPVKYTGGAITVKNDNVDGSVYNGSLSYAGTDSTTANRLAFTYTVTEDSPGFFGELNISGGTIEDVFGNDIVSVRETVYTDDSSESFTEVPYINVIRKSNAVPNAADIFITTADMTVEGELKDRFQLEVTLSDNEDLQLLIGTTPTTGAEIEADDPTHIQSTVDNPGTTSYSSQLAAKVWGLEDDLSSTFVRLFYKKDAGGTTDYSKLYADIPIDMVSAENPIMVELFLSNDTPSRFTDVVMGKTSAISQAPPSFIEDADLTYIATAMGATGHALADNKIDEDEVGNVITVDIMADADAFSFPNDITVTSSNESIFTVKFEESTSTEPPKVKITPTGNGAATFTVTANNAGLATAATWTSPEITVDLGERAYFAVAGSSEIISTVGKEFSLFFASNLNETLDASTPVNYTLKIMDGANELYTETITNYKGSGDNRASFKISGDTLNALPVGDYTATITTDSALLAGGGINAINYTIEIVPPSVVVNLENVSNEFYILDNEGTFDISWNIENWHHSADSQFELKVTKGGTTVYLDNVAPTESSGSVTIDIALVDRGSDPANLNYRDAYTATLKAKNGSDADIASDSFIFYVYDDDMMKIVSDMGYSSAVVLSNIQMIEQIVENAANDEVAQNALLALGGQIHLNETIYLDNEGYDFDMIEDQIKWAVEDNTIVGLFFGLNGAYYDLNELEYGTFAPTSEFEINGEKDGTTIITATHNYTGDEAELAVQVETLKDKLYLIDAYPNYVVNYTYTNGDGVVKTGKSNSEGEIAVYEPSGIASDINLDTYDADFKYFGTIYNEDLRTSEENGVYNFTYPVNNTELRKSAYTEIYFKNENGAPHNAQPVTIMGGVYVNGEYAENAQFIIGGIRYDGDKDEKLNLTTDNKGGIRLLMDITQFTDDPVNDPITHDDEIEYIFEAVIAGEYPVVIYQDAGLSVDEVKHLGDGIVYTKKAAVDDKPFLSYQTVGYEVEGYEDNEIQLPVGDTVYNFGPSENYPVTYLNSDYYWWGSSETDFAEDAFVLQDAYGKTFINQETETRIHEFSDMYRTWSTVKLDRAQMDNLSLDPKEYSGIKVVTSETEGLVYESFVIPQRVINLLDVVKVQEDQDLQPTLDTLSDLRISGDSEVPDADGLELLTGGLEALTGLLSWRSGSPMEVLFAPTADPLVYTAMLSIGSTPISTGEVEHNVQLNILDGTQAKTKTMPTVMDKQSLASGSSADKLNQDLDKLKQPSSSGGRMIFVPPSLGGYIEAEFRYIPETDSWDFYIISGGFNTDMVIGYRYSHNTLIGPVPVTMTMELAGTVGLAVDFQQGSYYDRRELIQVGPGIDEYILPEAERGVDILTELRVGMYFEVFAGLGFDLSVVAAKIGVFGRVELTAGFRWLNRPYVDESGFENNYLIPEVIGKDNVTDLAYNEVLNAQTLTLGGRVGIRFEFKFLFIEYKKELASASFQLEPWVWNEYDAISEIWARNDRVNGNPVDLVNIGGAEVTLINYGAMTESRAYLDIEPRSYSLNNMLYMAPASSLSADWNNIYPYAAPIISSDGKIMAYLDDNGSADIEDTEVFVTTLGDSAPAEGTKVNDANPASGRIGYGDSQIALDGTEDYYAVAYVRQKDSLDIPHSTAMTDEEVMQQTFMSEVYVSINDGGVKNDVRLSNNDTADMAPVVAVGDNYTFVAWREVASSDLSGSPTNYDAKDNIVYNIIDKASGLPLLQDPSTLYDGSNGNVKSVTVDMIDDTAMVSYVLDTDFDEATLSDREVVATLVDTTNVVADEFASVQTVNLTTDNNFEENVQLTTADIGGTEHFVLAWHSVEEISSGGDNPQYTEVSDIRLIAMDKDGAINTTVPAALSDIGATSESSVGTNFRFSKNAGDITDIAFAWEDTVAIAGDENTETANDSVINAVKFITDDNGKLGLSGVAEIASMPTGVTASHFDYYKTSGTEYKAMILGTDYTGATIAPQPATLNTTDADGNPIDVSVDIPTLVTQTNLYTATQAFTNTVRIEGASVDFEAVRPSDDVQVGITVTNTGKDKMTGLSVDVGGVSQTGLEIEPGEQYTIYTDMPVGDPVRNIPYVVTATYDNAETATAMGVLHLEYPDVGISNAEVSSAGDGMREVRFSLYNGLNIPLEDSGKTVKVAVFSTSNYLEEDEDGNSLTIGNTVTVSGDELTLIDNGVYSSAITVDVADLLALNPTHTGEIPDGGIDLYVKAWVEATDSVGGKYEQNEYYLDDNYASVKVLSLAEQKGEQVSTDMVIRNEGGVTNVDATLTNNTLQPITHGNMLAQLVDGDGNILETVQLYSGTGTNGLVSLGAEESLPKTIAFTQEGANVLLSFGTVSTTKSAELASITIDSFPLSLADFDSNNEANIEVNDLVTGLYNMSVTAKSTTATITINSGATADTSTDSNIYSGQADIKANPSKISFTVTDGSESETYIVNISENTVNADRPDREDTATSPTTPTAPSMSFTDIRSTDWFYDAVKYMFDNELMNGVSDTLFAPNTELTRAMFVTILHRIEGTPSASASVTFADVEDGAWYEDAVKWASSNGIVNGYSDVQFAPNDSVTREQMAAIMFRYATYKGYDISNRAELDQFIDSDEVSAWATEAMKWATGSALINGKGGGLLDPVGSATRAEVATIIMRFVEAHDDEE